MIKTSHSVRIVNHPNFVPDAAKSGFYLEIQKGRTQFPYRPVRTGRFLIGNGAGCDLRLGGTGVPPLHCIVHYEDGRFRLESVATVPELQINNKPVDSAVLSDGDHVRIGPIEFIARFAVPEPRAATAARIAIADSELTVNDEFDESLLGELSAEQLVDLIDREQTVVDEFETRRELGGRTLLHAALGRNRIQEVATTDHELIVSEIELLRRLEGAVERLSRFAGTAAAEEADTTLADRLQSLADRVSEPIPVRGVA